MIKLSRKASRLSGLRDRDGTSVVQAASGTDFISELRSRAVEQKRRKEEHATATRLNEERLARHEGCAAAVARTPEIKALLLEDAHMLADGGCVHGRLQYASEAFYEGFLDGLRSDPDLARLKIEFVRDRFHSPSIRYSLPEADASPLPDAEDEAAAPSPSP